MFSVGEASTGGSEVSGTYEVKDGYLVMKYKDEDNVNVTFLIKVASSSSSSLVLTMDKESLFKTAEAMVASDPEGAAAVQLALAFLEKISVTFKYKKG